MTIAPSDLAVMWGPTIKTLKGLSLSPEQRDRVEQITRSYSAIAQDLVAALDTARRNPYLNGAGIADATDRAKEKARQSMSNVALRLNAFREEVRKSVTLPESVGKVPHQRQEEIRKALATRDPLELRAAF